MSTTYWQLRSKSLRKTLGVLGLIQPNPFVKDPWTPQEEGSKGAPYRWAEPIAVCEAKVQELYQEFLTLKNELEFQSLHISTLIEKCEDRANITKDREARFRELQARIATYKNLPEFYDVVRKMEGVEAVTASLKTGGK